MEKQGRTGITRRQAMYFGIAVLMSLLIIASIYNIILLGLQQRESTYLKLMIAVLGMLFAEILFIACCVNNREDTRQGHLFAAVSALLFTMIFFSGLVDALEGTVESGRLLLELESLGSVLSAMVHLLLWFYQCASLPKTRVQRYFTRWIHVLMVTYIALVVVNVFTGFLVYVDESGYLQWPGEWAELGATSAFYVSYLLYVLPQKCPLKKKIAIASFAVFPLLVIAVTTIWFLAGITTTVLSISYTFVLLAVYVLFFCDYTTSQELFLAQKVEIAEQKRRQTELQTALVLSQIRPHFLYNALTAIRNLCKNDAAKAYTALGRFADYLRGNMEVLGSGRSISFEKELEHIQTYLSLEQMRFGNELKVKYDIQYKDFSLPALTVQPIVENAVCHGATMNENGGIVTVRSVRTEKGIAISVTDNGPGFDATVPPSDGRTHFGLDNVRACLTASGCGDLQIDSTPGIGTTVTILIKEGWK